MCIFLTILFDSSNKLWHSALSALPVARRVNTGSRRFVVGVVIRGSLADIGSRDTRLKID